MKKTTVAKLMLFLVFAAFVAASCRGPKECWGVSSDAASPQQESSCER
jgi:uncharacterized lipoprotein YajG